LIKCLNIYNHVFPFSVCLPKSDKKIRFRAEFRGIINYICPHTNEHIGMFLYSRTSLELSSALGNVCHTRVYPEVSGLSYNEINNNNNNNNNNKHSLRSYIKGYSGKSHYTDSQNSDTTAPSGRELYHLQFSLQAVSPETFGYTLVNVFSGRK
jgi:hypothetical protein